MYKLNSVGANTDLYGNPSFIFRNLLSLLSKKTRSKQFVSILLINSTIFLQLIVLINLYINPCLHTVSYAADRSANVTLVVHFYKCSESQNLLCTTTVFSKTNLL